MFNYPINYVPPNQQRQDDGNGNSSEEDVTSSDNSSDEEEEQRQSYIPKPRPVEELYAEDERVAPEYSTIREQDDNIFYDNFFEEVTTLTTWEDCHLLSTQLLKNLVDRCKYPCPRKIQCAAFPFIFDGYDVVVQAETSSGKTLAYLVPIIDKIFEEKHQPNYVPASQSSPYAIIIVPTREICLQVYEIATKIAYQTGVSCAKAYGGYYLPMNDSELSVGCDILIACPGRLKQFVLNDKIRFNKLKFFVLDEADQLLYSYEKYGTRLSSLNNSGRNSNSGRSSDNGTHSARSYRSISDVLNEDDETRKCFVPDILQVITYKGFPKIAQRQTMLFSASLFDWETKKAAEDFIKLDYVGMSNAVERANRRVTQNFVYVADDQRFYRVLDMLRNEVADAGGDVHRIRPTIIFLNKRERSNHVAELLNESGIPAIAINADKDQEERERALDAFRKNEIPVLVSSDVSHRGLDLKEVKHVINLDTPWNYKTYIYRIGRAGRISQGFSTTFVGEQGVGTIIDIARNMTARGEELPGAIRELLASNRNLAAISSPNESNDDDLEDDGLDNLYLYD